MCFSVNSIGLMYMALAVNTSKHLLYRASQRGSMSWIQNTAL